MLKYVCYQKSQKVCLGKTGGLLSIAGMFIAFSQFKTLLMHVHVGLNPGRKLLYYLMIITKSTVRPYDLFPVSALQMHRSI